MSVTLGPQFVQASWVPQSEAQWADAISITLTQPPGSTARWLFVVKARTPEGLAELGRFATCPPAAGSPKTRVVAVAACPGALDWTVDISPVDSPDPDLFPSAPDDSSVSLAGGQWSKGPGGVVRVNERPKLLSGVAGAQVILWGETVLSWAASSAAGGTVTITDLVSGVVTVVVVPANGSVAGGDGGLLDGPLSFVFAGTDSYLVELAESA